MKKTNNHSALATVGVAAGLAATAAVGVYFLYGSKHAKKYRSTLKSWMFTAKGEIIEGLEKLENVTEAQYHALVDTVSHKYQAMQHIDREDITRFVTDMKKHWKDIVKAATPQKARAKK